MWRGRMWSVRGGWWGRSWSMGLMGGRFVCGGGAGGAVVCG